MDWLLLLLLLVRVLFFCILVSILFVLAYDFLFLTMFSSGPVWDDEVRMPTVHEIRHVYSDITDELDPRNMTKLQLLVTPKALVLTTKPKSKHDEGQV